MCKKVGELEEMLAAVEDENTLLLETNAELQRSIDEALPLWRRAWEEFVLKGAGELGAGVGKITVFHAGFVAGMLYSGFTAVPPGMSV